MALGSGLINHWFPLMRPKNPSSPTPLARPCWVWNLASTKGGLGKNGQPFLWLERWITIKPPCGRIFSSRHFNCNSRVVQTSRFTPLSNVSLSNFSGSKSWQCQQVSMAANEYNAGLGVGNSYTRRLINQRLRRVDQCTCQQTQCLLLGTYWKARSKPILGWYPLAGLT